MTGTNRVVLTTSTSNDVYYDMLLVFLVSLQKAGGYTGEVRVDLLNGTDQNCADIMKLCPSAVINRIKTDSGMMPTVYTRPAQIRKALGDGYAQVAAIDADIIVRKPIENIWDDLGPNTVKAWNKKKIPPLFPDGKSRKRWMTVKHPRLDKRACIQGGVQLYGNGPRTQEFYDEVMRRLGTQWKFWDGQIIIYKMLRKKYAGITYLNLGPMYNDSFFNEQTVMWHVKHHHFTDPRWVKETQKWKTQITALLSE